MKVLILGGFLGSGKTSLLLQLAYYITGNALNDKKYQVVILENEVGEEGIDDKLLRGNGYQVENLFSGCACCTLSGELLSTVSKIEKELQPDWLILETTGLAYPLLRSVPKLYFVLFFTFQLLIGWLTACINVPLISYFQTRVPLEQQGRFFALLAFFSGILIPLGISYPGVLADWLGPGAAYACNNLCVIVLVLLVRLPA